MPFRAVDAPGIKGEHGRLVDQTEAGMNTKLHAICHSRERPCDLFVTAG
ncbi:hypothetical protein GGQ68_004439 [Sagittula marina]|uniref:Uncharacterized protein n=1 Tax=Sagittula marina TaxID=943940 RepID=A0A7W6GV12_9RHOB|nr:hypothetical protein [Sagittula marina]